MNRTTPIQATRWFAFGLVWGVLGAQAQTLPAGVREFVPPPELQETAGSSSWFFLEKLERGWELLVPSDGEGNEPLQTVLWRWEGNTATRVATIPGIFVKVAYEVASGRNGVRRLFLWGGVRSPLSSHPLSRTKGYMVVDLPAGGAPRTVWLSTDVAEMLRPAPYSVAVNGAGTRWAALLPRQEGEGARLLIGELPSTRPSYRLEWVPSGGPELKAVLGEFAEESTVFFLEENRLLMIPSGFPMLVEIQGSELRRTLLGVPAPVADVYFQKSTRTLWIAERINMDAWPPIVKPRNYYGFVLPEAGSGLLGETLAPSFRYTPEELGLASYASRELRGFLSDSVAVFLVRNDQQKELVSVRLDGPQGPQILERIPVPTNLGTTVSLGLREMVTKQTRRRADGRNETVFYRIDLTRYRGQN
jgi:hypothetical protein